jgi:hypothetical protein
VNEDASIIPASTATTTIQRKTTVGKTDDPLEHEADKTADKIMRMPEHPFIQRKGSCSCGEYDDDHVHLKPLTKQVTPFIQSKNGGAVSDGVASKIRSTKGNGASINGHAKSYMENRFGADFSNVKIHTGDESVQLSRALNAKAFTVGNDIYFNKDQYQPETDKGKHLLAHELTHVVQQSNNIQAKNMIQRQVEVTCSVDLIKIGRLWKGDKSAAIEILNCCEKGLSPLPAGCSKDVIDAAKKLLGKDKGKKDEQFKCNFLDFHSAHSESYKGMCCKGSIESAKDCCPPYKITTGPFPRCCQMDEDVQGDKCVKKK